MGELKRCAKCQEEKLTTCFNKHKTASDGLQRYCKDCNKEYSQNYYKSNIETIKSQRKTAAIRRLQIKELNKIKEEQDAINS